MHSNNNNNKKEEKNSPNHEQTKVTNNKTSLSCPFSIAWMINF